MTVKFTHKLCFARSVYKNKSIKNVSRNVCRKHPTQDVPAVRNVYNDVADTIAIKVSNASSYAFDRNATKEVCITDVYARLEIPCVLKWNAMEYI